MNLYAATVPIFTQHLRSLGAWLDKAVAHLEAKKVDPERVLQQQLAIDQYPLVEQIQAVCDQAKFTVAKMTGREPPLHPDTETTLEQIRARLLTVIDYLATYTPADFEGCEDRPCSHTWMQGKSMRGGDYLDHFALPNFYFHYTTAYAILRHIGVDVGKLDYLGALPLR